MKTDSHNYTKYFLKEYNQSTQKFELIEIHFNRENWFFLHKLMCLYEQYSTNIISQYHLT